MKKKIIGVSLILIIIAYVIFNVVSYASNKTMYVGLNTTHSNGQGYGIGNPKSGGVGIWNLRNYDSTDRSNESSIQKELYCLKGDYGDSWEANSGQIIQYNLNYDLDTEREKLLNLLSADSATANGVITEILNDNTGIYKELLWIIDNVYIPGKSDKNQLLKKIGVNYDSSEGIYYYEAPDEYDYSDKIYETEWVTTLTDTDIKAVQQAVIWYMTNYKVDNNSKFDKTNTSDWLTLTVNDGNSYTQLTNYNQSTNEGKARYDQANILYNYLINSAEKNANKYDASGYKKPVEINVTGLTQNSNGKYELQSQRIGDNYVTGPIKINKNNDLMCDVKLKITNASTNTEISSSNYTFTDVNGKALGITDVEKLIGKTEGFYISISKDIAKEINIDITTNYRNKTKNIWLVGTENGNTSVSLKAEQPVLEVEETEQNDTVQMTANPKEFDLALRKYITQINGTNVTDTRVPNISLDTLQNGTTATYQHRKDPVKVSTGNTVTYKITIYNEGSKKGYAKEITDQLPTGLKYTGGSTISSGKNTYSVTYNSNTNQVTFTATTGNSLNAYQTNSLDSETLEFTCEVTATADTSTDKILTNVAWISKEYDSDAGKEITNAGDDRDSRPQNYPNVNKDNMENYKGNSSNKSDLIDNTYYYQGEQDDDDFEKLLIEPRKSITATKTWSDNNDQDGLRKNISSVKVNLLANNKVVKTADLTSANSWTYTFTDLPLKENGKTIEYSVAEATEISGYNTTVNGFTITNTHIPETIDIPVTKIWNDEDDNDKIRPDFVKIILKANGEKYKEATITSDMAVTQATTREAQPLPTWKYIFKGLPKYKDGEEIKYTIEEIVPDGYEAYITGDVKNGFRIVNYHKTEKIELSVKKVWNDNNNQDKKRPEEVILKLIGGKYVDFLYVILTSDGGYLTSDLNNRGDKYSNESWAITIENLYKYKDGEEIKYTVEEQDVPAGYQVSITGDMTTGFTVTNTYKKFDLALRKYITKVNNTNVTNSRVPVIDENTLQSGTTATYKHRKDPVIVKEGDVVTYQIAIYNEGQKTGYASQIIDQLPTGLKYSGNSTVTSKDSAGTNKNTYNVNYDSDKNKITFDITGTTNALNAYTQGKLDKEIIEIQCTVVATPDTTNSKILTNVAWISGAYDTENNTATPTDRDSQPETTPNVDKDNMEGYKGNKENKNELTDNNYYYKGEQDDDDFEKLVINPESTSISVKKVWDDNNNQDGIRPQSVSVSLIANGDEKNPVKTIELNSENSWTYTFTELPERANGENIKYTVIENTKIDGYTTQITNDNVSSTAGEVSTASVPEYTITNSHDIEKISINVNKIWDDDNDSDKIRPNSVTVRLKNGTKVVATATLNEENQWKYIFENLPAKENGEYIKYELEEIVPDGYEVNITQSDANNYTVTNKHIPNKKFDLALRKYITQINGNDLTTLGLATRVPNISETTLKTGTTATYKHRKDPVKVENGDIVTYKITVYNEGEKNGYASEIIDQLPTGLIYNPSGSVVSKNSKGEEKNKYTVKYEASTNRVTFNIVNTSENTAKELQAYSDGKLDSETIEIKCKVVYNPTTEGKNILTNVAWINGAYNTTNNLEIKNAGDDRDSEPSTRPNVNKDNMENYKGNKSNKDDLSDSSNYYKGEQDDDDFEKLYVKKFDLSLRKFITSVAGKELKDSNGKYTREPVVDITELKNGTATTAIYKHPKTPLALKVGDRVTYTIRVYNEGEIAGFANQIKDYLPPYLTYAKDSLTNVKYGWQISDDGRIATTTYLSNQEINQFDGKELDYKDVQIECIVSSNAVPYENITNIAEISEYKYGDTVVSKDIDSESNNIKDKIPDDKELPNYKKEQEKNEYVPGNEDDDDFEKVYVKEFDLALRKFITEVEGKEITSRIPNVNINDGQISYEHTKEPITLHVNDIVIYTIRVFNEGEIDGYASEISDDIPEYLEYLPDEETNVNYLWKMYNKDGKETTNSEEATKLKTSYLSKANGEDKLLKAFDGENVNYKDIKIAFKVKDPDSNKTIITNHAQISDDTDENGNPIKDKDSETDKWNEGEDDQDVEHVKVEYFDLSLLKFVSKIIVQEDGQEKITQTGYNGHEEPEPVVKVELHKKKLNQVTVKFGYGITITNEGDIPGYATEIKDYVPDGLKFDAEDNPQWKDEGNNLISTAQLQNKLLKPGESATVEVILTWINGPDNLALKTNTAEISKDKNEYGVPDRDSTPDNQKEGEDDIDIAKVILAVSTGTVKTYFMLATGLLVIVCAGVILIKKYVI